MKELTYDDHSYKGAEGTLADRDLLDECLEVARIWRDSETRDDRREHLQELGWEPEKVFPIDHLRPRFDAYKDGVAIEHEVKEQMRARWHLLKMQAHYQEARNQGSDGDTDTPGVDVGVMIYRTGENATLDRTKRELESKLFQEHFPHRDTCLCITIRDGRVVPSAGGPQSSRRSRPPRQADVRCRRYAKPLATANDSPAIGKKLVHPVDTRF